MRGSDERSDSLFSYVDLEARVPKDHPLRAIREIVNGALSDLTGAFRSLYTPLGRPSIPPEKLLRALLLQAFYSIRSERQLMEQLDFDLLFRWFVGLGVDDAVWDHSVFSKNRDRLLAGEVAAKVLAAVLNQPRVKRLVSSDHFSVDGTMIEAWASMKSFRPKGEDDPPSQGGGRNVDAQFRGERRSNETHESKTDPDAKLYRKGPGMEAKLCFLGHALMENRHGLIVDARLTRVSGHAERLAALDMICAYADRPHPSGPQAAHEQGRENEQPGPEELPIVEHRILRTAALASIDGAIMACACNSGEREAPSDFAEAAMLGLLEASDRLDPAGVFYFFPDGTGVCYGEWSFHHPMVAERKFTECGLR